MRFHLFSPITPKRWQPENLETGMGGCEQALGEMAWRMARKGQEVTVYTDTPGCEWRGTKWVDYRRADFNESGIWIIYRTNQYIKQVRQDVPLYFVAQDFDYEWGEGQLDRIDRFLVLCRPHRNYFVHRYPDLDKKIVVTSHGVKVDLIDELEQTEHKRNPYKIMYASSIDRGYPVLLQLMPRIRKIIPELELHVFYGIDTVEQIVASGNWSTKILEAFRDLKKKGEETEGVFWHGRVTQRELYEHWLTAGFMCYPSLHEEFTFVAGQEAQCCGAIPIVSNMWAQGENTLVGVRINGDPKQSLVQAHFAAEICRLAADREERIAMRKAMVPAARSRFNWERWVDQWIGLGEQDKAGRPKREEVVSA